METVTSLGRNYSSESQIFFLTPSLVPWWVLIYYWLIAAVNYSHTPTLKHTFWWKPKNRGAAIAIHSCSPHSPWPALNLISAPREGDGADDGRSCHELRAQRVPVLVPDIAADTALSLEGKGWLDYHLSPNQKRDYLMRLGAWGRPGVERLEVKFMTRSENGVLLHVQESSNFTTVKVRLRLIPGLIWLDCPVCSDQNRVFPLLFLFPL